MSAAPFDLQHFLKNLSSQPGVYQMLNAAGKVIYVGKARNLKKRVSSYFSRQLDTKTQVMVAQVARINIIIAASENAALLLEANLIKSLKPRYNVLLRDDKSYPYLYLSTQQAFPRLDFYRGARKKQGQYFGPYASAGSVRENLALVQKLFKIRQCNDTFFKNRTRPCLQYQIKRCTAPCVAYVSEQDYRKQVEHAIYFLQGKNNQIIDELVAKMDIASRAQQYEEAARLRDQVTQLRQLQQQQLTIGDQGNIDIVGIYQKPGQVAISLLQIRGGRLLGKRTYFPVTPAEITASEALAAFIPQYYLNPLRAHDLPKRIVLSEPLTERLWIQSALCDQLQQKITLVDRKLTQYRQWQKMAEMNAMEELMQHLAEHSQVTLKLTALQQVLRLPDPITRIECFDVSHTRGEAAVASCVVYGSDGVVKKDYRKYNITGITPGDDYAALRQALGRRYTQLKSTEAVLPDLLMIDGGLGQVRAVAAVLEELQVSGVVLMGVAKGQERKPGLETLWLWPSTRPLHLAPDNMALHLIQFVRDEAHRFALLAHRARRAKARQRSSLEEIDGVGAVRRQHLLKYFGGLQELRRASVADIARVPGISENLAQKIFDRLHED